MFHLEFVKSNSSKKLISSTLLLILIALFPLASSAQQSAPVSEEVTAVTVATVNIYDAKIVLQEGNKITLSFDISNREGAQPQIKYGVELIKEGPNGQTRVDEKVYDDTLSLSANSQVHKEIIYQAPTNLNGEYTILISSKNTNGFPLALALVGKVTLSAENNTDTVDILADTCFLQVQGEKDLSSYTVLQGVDISTAENITAVCTVINNTNKLVNLTPVYETHYRTVYGEIVPHEGGDTKPVTLNPLEKKSVSLILPKAIVPQAYDVKVSLVGDGMSTNAVSFRYTLQGESATILNIILDKDYYETGDTAKLSFMWSPSADKLLDSRSGSGTVVSKVLLSATIVNSEQKLCAAEIKQLLSQDYIVEIPVSITASCSNPQTQVTLKDDQGNVLAEESFIIESKLLPEVAPTVEPNPETNLSFLITATIFILLTIMILVAATVHLLRKKNNINAYEENI